MLRQYLLILFLFLYGIVSAQDLTTSSLVRKLLQHKSQISHNALFLHTDKQIYANNEYIWFSSYLLNSAEGYEAHQYLIVALLLEGRDTAMLQRKFVMENGRSWGSLRLTSDIPPGEYHLVALTNVLQGKDSLPTSVFVENISIRQGVYTSFNADMNIYALKRDNAEMDIHVFNPLDNKPMKNLLVGVDLDTLPTIYGVTNGDGHWRNKFNTADKQHHLIRVHITDNIEHVYLQQEWPEPVIDSSFVLRMHFVPESGRLVNGFPSWVGIESKTKEGIPLAVKAELLENGISIDTFFTDEKGMGKIYLWPHAGADYKVHILHKPDNVALEDSLLSFLSVNRDGFQLHIDTMNASLLKGTVYATHTQPVTLVIQDQHQIFWYQKMTASTAGTKMRINLDSIPKGIWSLTLFDTLEQAVAERKIFAHPQILDTLNIALEKNIFSKRALVKVRLTLPSDSTQQLGILSVACVKASRLDALSENDIVRYHYIDEAIGQLPKYNKSSSSEADYWNDLMLVKSWNPAVLQNLDENKPSAFSSKRFSPQYVAQVNNWGQKKQKGKNLILWSKQNFNVISSDSLGKIIIPDSALLAMQDQKLYATMEGDIQFRQRITMKDPFASLFKKIEMPPYRKTQYSFGQYSRDFLLPDIDSSTYLSEVVVSARRGKDYWQLQKIQSMPIVPSYSYYYCRFGIINCPNHPPGTPGTELVYLNESNEYSKDSNKKASLKLYGIQIPKEFTPEDMSKSNPLVPEFFSTLYWNPNLIIQPVKGAEIQFYTSDYTGSFKIILNGILGNDVIYQTKEFRVE